MQMQARDLQLLMLAVPALPPSSVCQPLPSQRQHYRQLCRWMCGLTAACLGQPYHDLFSLEHRF
jgi:hypothetical protein